MANNVETWNAGRTTETLIAHYAKADTDKLRGLYVVLYDAGLDDTDYEAMACAIAVNLERRGVDTTTVLIPAE